jgi:hypothetical protein
MKNYLQYGLAALLLMVVISSCKKDEFIPPPEGEKVPYTAPDLKSLGETLKASPYQLFLKLYQRSNMDSVLNSPFAHTLLAPTDAAMQAAGYTETSIDGITASEADALVAYFTIRGKFTREALQQRMGNLEGVTLLSRSDYKVYPYYYGNGTGSQQYDNYYYRHYILVSADKLLVNGLPEGDAKNGLDAKNGYIWPLENMLQKPVDKSFWQLLKADPRFSMLMEVQRLADSTYDKRYRIAFEEAMGYDPGGNGWVSGTRTNYEAKADLIPDFTGTILMNFNMMFAPTNEAFHKAGFQTVQEVMAWNDKYATTGVFDWNTWQISDFGFPSDTVLAYHWDFGRDNLLYSGTYGKAPGQMPTVFFGNDLNDQYLADYPVNHIAGSMIYIMPFAFGKSADGKPTVMIKGSDAPPATVIETIPTVMGPLHVVDRLLLPKNFKMN